GLFHHPDVLALVEAPCVSVGRRSPIGFKRCMVSKLLEDVPFELHIPMAALRWYTFIRDDRIFDQCKESSIHIKA
ncbi:MAG: hypothetical protein ACTSYT_02630, partial [Candidatus Asgardarchaeia archaeon]